MTPKLDIQRIIICQDIDGSELYAQVSGAEVVLTSHELAVGRGLSHWRERTICTTPVQAWKAIAGML